jgi:hypothetical protein
MPGLSSRLRPRFVFQVARQGDAGTPVVQTIKVRKDASHG